MQVALSKGLMMQILPLEEFIKSIPKSESSFLDTFLDLINDYLPPCSRQGPWIIGGTIRRICNKEAPTTDIDIMFKNKDEYDDYCVWLREHGAEIINENTRNSTYKYGAWKIQPICAEFSNTLNQTLSKFDFTICQFGFDGTNLMWGDHSMEHLNEKKLVFTRTNDHVSTMRRAFKYANQGFFMDHESIGKFLKDAIKQNEKVHASAKKWEAEASSLASGGFPFGGSAKGSSYSV